MKGKFEHGVFKTFVPEQLEQTRLTQLIEINATDEIISAIRNKNIDDITVDEALALHARKSFDNEWAEMLKLFVDYKDVIEDARPVLTELQVAMAEYEEAENAILVHWRIVDNDTFKVNEAIRLAKEQLSATDCKILKTYEARILDEAEPYSDIEAIIVKRRELRNKINELELILANK